MSFSDRRYLDGGSRRTPGNSILDRGSALIIHRAGEIYPGFHALHPIDVPVFLLEGSQPAFFDAGFACLGRTYADQIRGLLAGRSPAFCFLTHSHFDHLGAVAFLKKQFPEMAVCAHANIDQILQKPSAVERIRVLNDAGAASVAGSGAEVTGAEPFEPFVLDRHLGGGDEVFVSDGIPVRVFHTPGHTRDCLSYYIPETKTLIASEALGIPDHTGYVVTDFLVDYDAYMDSMRALNNLAVEVLCFGHSYIYTGEDARTYIPKAMKSAQAFYGLVETCLAEEKGDLERVKIRIKEFEYDGKPDPKQPEPAYLLNLEARILTVQRRINQLSGEAHRASS